MGLSPLSISTSQLRSLIAAEIGHQVDMDRLRIIQVGTRWYATLASDGSRVDEEQLAVVSTVGRRLVGRYSIVPGDDA